jgi:cysteine desulfurase/selenocysteine lyase
MQPYHGGGEMIDKVTFEKTTFNSLPYKFEAGTPNISGAIALAEAIKYLEGNQFSELIEYEDNLTKYLQNRLLEIEDIVIYGNSLEKLPVFSFNIKGIHHYDLGTLLDSQGIAVRTGNHCTQTIMQHFDIPGTLRVSLSFYNTTQEIDYFIEKLKTNIGLLRG